MKPIDYSSKNPNTTKENPENFEAETVRIPRVTNEELKKALSHKKMIDYLKTLGFEEKEAKKPTKITTQGENNNKLYIIPAGTTFMLIKDGKKEQIELSEDTVIGEATFLEYLKEEKKASANATVEIQGIYYVVSFEKFKKRLENNLSKSKIIEFLESLKEKRKNKTNIVTK